MTAPAQTLKHFVDGTHRTRDPSDTLARIRPHFASFGITRIADVTGLDTIGVPVCMSVRPNAKGLAVSQGKGITLEHARASAAMEAIELFHAENDRLARVTGSYREVLQSSAALDPAALSLCRGSVYHPDLSIEWVPGVDMFNGEPVLVPYDLVHGDVTAPAKLPCFCQSSNGLASGNHILEATIHALCEVVERDATAVHGHRIARGEPQRLIDLDSVRHPAVQAIRARLSAASVSLYAWDETTEVGVPCVSCLVLEEQSRNLMPIVVGDLGHGCHPSRDVAFLRALTEAVQSRLTYIAGARDDMFRESYDRISSAILARSVRDRFQGVKADVDFGSLPDIATPTLEGDLDALLLRMQRAGFRRAVCVDLSRPEFDVFVVRVLVPGLEFEQAAPAQHSPRGTSRGI